VPQDPASELVSRIGQAVEAAREATIKLHQSFVRAASVTGAEGPMSACAAEAFRARGLDVETWAATADEMRGYLEHVGEQPGYEDRLNVVGKRKGSGGGR
jgi:hypothetical protein